MPIRTVPQPPHDLEPRFVSVADMARILGIGRTACYDVLDRGLVPSKYHGKRRLIPLDAVHAYADSLPSERV